MSVTLSARVEMEFDGIDNGWTDVRQDLIGGLRIRRGLRGDGPNERVASPGSMTFALNNSAANSQGLLGSYSFDHVNKRAGFGPGIRVRACITRNGIGIATSSVANPSVITTSVPHYLVSGQTVAIAGHSGSTPSINGDHEVTVISGTTFSIPVNVTVDGTGGTMSVDYVQMVGKIRKLSTAPGRQGVGGVGVTVTDWMQEALKTKLTGLEIRDSVRADELIQDVLDAMTRQPSGTSFDEGTDLFAFAFDSIGDTVHSEFSRIARSGYDLIYTTREDVLRYENRNYRLTHNVTPDVVIDGTMIEMTPDVDVDRVVNRVIGTAHPRSVDANFSVLFTLDSQEFLAPGEMRTFSGKYTDTSSQGQKVGAVDVQEPVPGVDYLADTSLASSVGSADTPFIIRPTATGSYNSFSGTAASVADQNNATGAQPTGGVQYQSYLFGAIAAPDNAAIANLRLIATILHNDTSSHFANWYPLVRVASVDLVGTIWTEVSASPVEVIQPFPNPPGAGDWTAGLINGGTFEAGGAFNWDSATPSLLELRVEGLYASAVAPTDRTSDFSVEDFRPAGDSFEVDIKNNGTDGAYLTRLNIRGRRITSYQEQRVFAVDQDSIDAYGQSELSFDMPYQGNAALVQTLIDYILSAYKDPQTFLPSITILGNRTDELTAAALRLDISSLVSIVEDVTGLDKQYFVNGVEMDFDGNIIAKARWLLAPADETAWWAFDVPGRTELGTTNIFAPI